VWQHSGRKTPVDGDDWGTRLGCSSTTALGGGAARCIGEQSKWSRRGKQRGVMGLGFDDSPRVAVDKDGKCTWGRRSNTVPDGDGQPNVPTLGAGHSAGGPWPTKT
jgi:hypothetical protein